MVIKITIFFIVAFTFLYIFTLMYQLKNGMDSHNIPYDRDIASLPEPERLLYRRQLIQIMETAVISTTVVIQQLFRSIVSYILSTFLSVFELYVDFLFKLLNMLLFCIQKFLLSFL